MNENRHILVVDDNELFRESVVETLRRLGHAVESAPDGQTACTLVNPGKYDLIISDMKMPGMSGIELLEQVKRTDPDVPFLIITAYGAIETAVDAMKKGAFDFIQKSDNLIRELELTVERTLEYRRLFQENQSRLRDHLESKGMEFIEANVSGFQQKGSGAVYQSLSEEMRDIYDRIVAIE